MSNPKYLELREKYPTFTYESFDVVENHLNIAITYTFIISEHIRFSPIIIIPKKTFNFEYNITDPKLNNIIFNIGLIELISYWKCTCSPNIIIKAGFLDQKQISFWKKLYYNGLGEFFYLNSINAAIDNFMNIEILSSSKYTKESFCTKEENLIPIGGGKDSIVTMELLKEFKETNTCLIINPRNATLDSAHTAGYSNNILELYRTIDKRLLALNSEGFLNGHTPFSAVLGFISILCSALLGKKYIALSNESSANESTVPNSNINHQYSKSFEFELDFSNYIHEYITDDILYFSLLRPFSELKITKLFSQNSQYYDVFKSCNKGSKTDVWCCKCPKCLFVYILLSPFIEEVTLIKIFGSNLLDDKDLLFIFKQLIGIEKEKPFECVGTKSEVNAALSYVLSNYKGKLPYLLDYYKNNASHLIVDIGEFNRILNYFDENNLIPEKFSQCLNQDS